MDSFKHNSFEIPKKSFFPLLGMSLSMFIVMQGLQFLYPLNLSSVQSINYFIPLATCFVLSQSLKSNEKSIFTVFIKYFSDSKLYFIKTPKTHLIMAFGLPLLTIGFTVFLTFLHVPFSLSKSFHFIKDFVSTPPPSEDLITLAILNMALIGPIILFCVLSPCILIILYWSSQFILPGESQSFIPSISKFEYLKSTLASGVAWFLVLSPWFFTSTLFYPFLPFFSYGPYQYYALFRFFIGIEMICLYGCGLLIHIQNIVVTIFSTLALGYIFDIFLFICPNFSLTGIFIGMCLLLSIFWLTLPSEFPNPIMLFSPQEQVTIDSPQIIVEKSFKLRVYAFCALIAFLTFLCFVFTAPENIDSPNSSATHSILYPGTNFAKISIVRPSWSLNHPAARVELPEFGGYCQYHPTRIKFGHFFYTQNPPQAAEKIEYLTQFDSSFALYTPFHFTYWSDAPVHRFLIHVEDISAMFFYCTHPFFGVHYSLKPTPYFADSSLDIKTYPWAKDDFHSPDISFGPDLENSVNSLPKGPKGNQNHLGNKINKINKINAKPFKPVYDFKLPDIHLIQLDSASSHDLNFYLNNTKSMLNSVSKRKEFTVFDFPLVNPSGENSIENQPMIFSGIPIDISLGVSKDLEMRDPPDFCTSMPPRPNTKQEYCQICSDQAANFKIQLANLYKKLKAPDSGPINSLDYKPITKKHIENFTDNSKWISWKRHRSTNMENCTSHNAGNLNVPFEYTANGVYCLLSPSHLMSLAKSLNYATANLDSAHGISSNVHNTAIAAFGYKYASKETPYPPQYSSIPELYRQRFSKNLGRQTSDISPFDHFFGNSFLHWSFKPFYSKKAKAIGDKTSISLARENFKAIKQLSPDQPVYYQFIDYNFHQALRWPTAFADRDLSVYINETLSSNPNSIIFLVSDHGMHYTKLQKDHDTTFFLAILPSQYQHYGFFHDYIVEMNQKRSISMLDIYQTLRDLFKDMSGRVENSGNPTSETSCSLFDTTQSERGSIFNLFKQYVDPKRTCFDAFLQPWFCRTWQDPSNQKHFPPMFPVKSSISTGFKK